MTLRGGSPFACRLNGYGKNAEYFHQDGNGRDRRSPDSGLVSFLPELLIKGIALGGVKE